MKTLQTLEDLAPAAYNPRKISAKAASGLSKSIEEFGDISGITWNRRTGNLISGHQRVEQLRKLGAILHDGAVQIKRGDKIHRFDVRVVDFTVAQEKAANVAANNPHIGGEFTDDLAALLGEVKCDLGDDLFGELALDALLKEFPGPQMPVDEDEVPEPPAVPVTKLGDVWTLGDHQLMCGDSFENIDFLKGCDALISDPPYGVKERTERKSNGRSNAAECNDFARVYGDDIPFDPSPFIGFPKVILFGANYFSERLPRSPSWIVWDKRDGVASDDNADCEIAWSNLGGPARIFRHLWKGMIKASEKTERRVHPTQKPVALMSWCIDQAKARIIADPFCGSGPLVMAAEHMARQCLAIEISPAYCDIIVERWQALTNGKATRKQA